MEFGEDEMEAVIKLVQTFDPPGVAARDLPECLLLQLGELPPDTPWRAEAIDLVRDHFELLAGRDFATLARRVRLTDGELVETMTLIRSLNPRPGGNIGGGVIEYVEPDVTVAKRSGRWTVELNRGSAPRVRINDDYAGMIRRGDASADNQYLKNNLQDAKWFLKNLEYRNETLLKVAASIVHRQIGFLERGEEAMQPLVLADIATAVDRHESTVSRVTTRKYMETPRGVFELKYFFSSHVGTVNGGEVSSTRHPGADPKADLAGESPQAAFRQQDRRGAQGTRHQGGPAHRRQVPRVHGHSTVQRTTQARIAASGGTTLGRAMAAIRHRYRLGWEPLAAFKKKQRHHTRTSDGRNTASIPTRVGASCRVQEKAAAPHSDERWPQYGIDTDSGGSLLPRSRKSSGTALGRVMAAIRHRYRLGWEPLAAFKKKQRHRTRTSDGHNTASIPTREQRPWRQYPVWVPFPFWTKASKSGSVPSAPCSGGPGRRRTRSASSSARSRSVMSWYTRLAANCL